MPLCFAYGSNMDVAAMAERCPRSKPLGLAKLARHRLAIMREGWLTVTRDGRSNVHGMLWDLALADVRALDKYEGLGQGLYSKAIQPVIAAGGPKRALIYLGANAGPGRANADYISSVWAAATSAGLPEEGLRGLHALAIEAGVKVEFASAPKPAVRPRFATPFDL